jgi:hypothetical protein
MFPKSDWAKAAVINTHIRGRKNANFSVLGVIELDGFISCSSLLMIKY